MVVAYEDRTRSEGALGAFDHSVEVVDRDMPRVHLRAHRAAGVDSADTLGRGWKRQEELLMRCLALVRVEEQ